MLGYKAALQWVVDNDDTEWLTSEYGSPSVTAVFLADIYERSIDKVVRDLRKVEAKTYG